MYHSKKNNFLKICCHIIFLIYLVLLIKIVLFKYIGSVTAFEKLITEKLTGFRSLNIIPFRSIWEFTKLMFDGHFSRGFNNIAGNVFIFAPFGYFLPLLYKKFQKAKIVVAAGAFVSLFFEISQYLLYLGSADIDDIILNTLGALLGFSFFKIVKKITYRNQTAKYVVTIILSVIGFIVAGYLAIDYFGIMFGLRNRSSQSGKADDFSGDLLVNEQAVVISDHGSDNISDDNFDIWGDIISFDDTSVTINKTDIQDFDNGVSVATINIEDPDLQTVYITETTKYTQKDIYDVNGDRVEIREAGREDLEMGKHINIKGYRSDDKFFATEIIINHYLFM